MTKLLSYSRVVLILVFLSNVLFCSAQINFKQKEKLINKIEGYGILYRLPGLWSGPVTTTTSAGDFDNWFVDLRPVSKNQITQFSLLDANTVNNFSIFVVKYKGKKRIALRTEGCFANSCCITYEILDSVNEAEGYYRFSDFIGGPKRAHTEFLFRENRLTMQTYTNKFNKENGPVLHSVWEAQLHASEEAQRLCKQYKFPKPKPVVDLTNGFINKSESIFFEFNTDPYKSSDQPVVGKLDISINVNEKFNVSEEDEILVLLTVKSLFNDLNSIDEYIKYSSKSVYLPGTSKNFIFNNIHPGEYYVYVFVDRNSDKQYQTGDLMTDPLIENKITIEKGKVVTCTNHISYQIP